MSRHILKTVLFTAFIATTGAIGGYWFAQRPHAAAVMTTAASSSAQKPLYWYDPMAPDQHFDKPGKSPFMDMPLTPKYADGNEALPGLRVDNTVLQNTGIRYATVTRGRSGSAVEAPATVGFNERDIAIVQTRTGGFVEKTYDRAPGDMISAGAPLLDLLVPEWAGAQAEYLALRQTGDVGLTQAARNRLRLLGMPDSLIQRVDQTGQVQNTLTISAPIGGVIQSLDIRQGMTVSPGMTVARLNGLGTVWLEAAIPEAQAGQVRPGQTAVARLDAYPDLALSGQVIAILPEVNTLSRTLRVRLAFPNPRQQLRPGLYAQVRLVTAARTDALLVPSESVIRTGKRTVLISVDRQGRFQPVTVTTGGEADGQTVILSGVQAGERVVASGQFLIDSEASLQGVLTRLASDSAATMTAPSKSVPASADIEAWGVIEAISVHEITLSHEPIPALDWPAMTMAFPVAAEVKTAGLKVGQRVRFTLVKGVDTPTITAVRLQGGQP